MDHGHVGHADIVTRSVYSRRIILKNLIRQCLLAHVDCSILLLGCKVVVKIVVACVGIGSLEATAGAGNPLGCSCLLLEMRLLVIRAAVEFKLGGS